MMPYMITYDRGAVRLLGGWDTRLADDGVGAVTMTRTDPDGVAREYGLSWGRTYGVETDSCQHCPECGDRVVAGMSCDCDECLDERGEYGYDEDDEDTEVNE